MSIISNLDNKIKLRFISEFLIKLSNFLIIPIITYNIGIEQYSAYIILVSLINGFLPIFLLGLNFTIIKKLATIKSLEVNTQGIVNSFILITSCFIFFIILSPIIINNFFSELSTFTYIIIIITYVTTLQLVLFEFLRSKLQSNIFCYFQIFDSIFLVLILILFGEISKLNLQSILLLIFTNKTLSIIGIIIYLITKGIIKFENIRFNKNILKDYVNPGLIFIALGISEWFINFSDKIILNYFLPPLYLSIYFTSAMFASTINSLGSVFWWDLLPKLTTLKKQKKEKKIYDIVKIKNSHFTEYSIYLSFLVIIFSPIIQFVILNSNFEVSYFIYFVLLMSVYFHQISTGWEFYCYVNKRSNFIFLNSIFTGFLGFILYIILIPSFQILGALISLFLTKVIHMFSLMIYARKHGYKGNIIDKKTYHKLIIFMLCILLFFIFSDLSFSALNEQFNSLIKFFIIIFTYFSLVYLTKNFCK